MDEEKRKHEDGEGDDYSSAKRGKPAAAAGRNEEGAAPPGDEEVDEFFAILKRIHVAVKYFQERGAVAAPEKSVWTPAFRREDFEGVKGSEDEPKKKKKMDAPNAAAGLDLNSDLTSSDVSDSS
ncbi:protein NEGATIVE REGULATOR OF RESISTANCE-like [Andrographis paniculata]|uniref:protein NEGATIVE REGULATOR OF RESISTANCE-like n=1 Tax=Andrographis paniculata TaxID=175694 RepID=UPI0021E83AD6|nr:protein NEGATIVE REGULATOR OF RESISTANCE-like [Andrographis paniculata]